MIAALRSSIVLRSTLICSIILLLFVSRNASGERLVFAHYMLTNQDYQADTDATQELKIAAYEREIKQAQAIGIDGFALNAGGWLREPYYIRYASQMFEAAVRLNSGFKLMFSADMCCGNAVDDVEDMMRRFASNPRYAPVYFKYKGAFVLTTFAGDKLGVATWQQIRSDLKTGSNPSTHIESNILAATGQPSNTPLNIFLVPAFSGAASYQPVAIFNRASTRGTLRSMARFTGASLEHLAPEALLIKFPVQRAMQM